MAERADPGRLFEPVRVGAIGVPNRIVMAPMTRSRAGAGDAVGDLQVEYYTQRAGAGLIISEGTYVAPEGKGYIRTPGIFTEAQVAGWQRVTDAVHEKGGRIVAQLWHVGRLSHRAFQPGGALPVAPSAVAPTGKVLTENGMVPYETPRALDRDEIARIVEEYARGAVCARRAGFDGVEIHGANGYLVEQFLKDETNRRDDEYGGSVENRARFAVEVARAVANAWSADRVGLRISPIGRVSDSDPLSLYRYLVRELRSLGLMYLHVRESPGSDFDYAMLRREFGGIYIANDSYDAARAEAAIADGRADLIAFGRPFIANPDLVERIRIGAPLAEPDRATFYAGEEKGYTDYPGYEAMARTVGAPGA